MEYWDIYDEFKNKTGKVLKRGDKLNDDEYHLVTNAWIKNSKGEFLITQRSSTKAHPLMWECTGGSAVLGEDTYMAAMWASSDKIRILYDNNMFEANAYFEDIVFGSNNE